MTLIGLDIGGTKIEGALIQRDTFKIITRFRVPTPKSDYQSFLAQVNSVIMQLLTYAKSNKYQVLSIGIGCCGSLNQSTGLMAGANVLCLNGNPFLHDLQSVFDYPIAITNDANSLAISEFYLGAAKDRENSCLSVIIGTGCGSGLIINGQIVDGFHGCGGEIGHNPLPHFNPDVDGEAYQCYCGAWNCNEFYVSGTGIERTYQNKFGHKKSAKDIFDLATIDELTAKHVELFIDQFARVLGSIVNVVDPEIIVLGGGVSNQQQIYPKLKLAMSNYVFRDKVETEIVPAVFGDSSGVVGAAILPIMKKMI